MLNKKEFDIMVCLLEHDGDLTQKKIAQELKMSVGGVNKIIKDLNDRELLNRYAVTENGLESLEPYRVKNACFLAAGFGSRLVPITLNTPKPLVRVHGVRIIDTLLDAVVAAGIENIYIVCGYLREQFELLYEKYPMIHLIDNPDYNVTNNISSAVLLGDKVVNSYMFEADLFLRNPKLVTKYQYSTNFLGIPMERTDDYCFHVKNGRIVARTRGGYNCFQTVGIAYYNESDGKLYQEMLKKAYDSPGGKELFTGDSLDLKKMFISYRECSIDDVIEIDTFKELQDFDPAYRI